MSSPQSCIDEAEKVRINEAEKVQDESGRLQGNADNGVSRERPLPGRSTNAVPQKKGYSPRPPLPMEEWITANPHTICDGSEVSTVQSRPLGPKLCGTQFPNWGCHHRCDARS